MYLKNYEIGQSDNASYVTRLDLCAGLEHSQGLPRLRGRSRWDGLYHRYQDYLLHQTVHNHFIQVWVEAGTIGLWPMPEYGWLCSGR